MSSVLLVFPDIMCIADFVIKYEVGNVEINSLEHTISGLLPDKLIMLACAEYGAYLKAELSFS